jgi:hypothetical protein
MELFAERQMVRCAPPRLGRTVVVYASAVLDQSPPVQKQLLWSSTAKGEVTVLSRNDQMFRDGASSPAGNGPLSVTAAFRAIYRR